MRKELFLAIPLVLLMAVDAYAKTRLQVVADATAMVVIPQWTATNNSYVFNEAEDIAFQSHFTTGTASAQWPYVYGGKENAQATHDRIVGGVSPGGRNVYDPALTTEWLYDNGYWPAQHLAGIDCSGFACRALGYVSDINNTNTTKLPQLSLQIDSSKMGPGDLLIAPGVHVRVVVSTTPTLEVAEAAGGAVGYARRATVGVGGYEIHTPFPSFSNITPANGALINEARPEIRVTIKAGTNNLNRVLGGSIRLKIDGEQKTIPAYSENNEIQVSYTPTEDLTDGEHTLYVYAKNELNLEDDTSVGFPIADRQFLVESKKLMLDRFVQGIC